VSEAQPVAEEVQENLVASNTLEAEADQNEAVGEQPSA